MRQYVVLLGLCLGFIQNSQAQGIDENQLGAWYMYFWNTTIGESGLGFQGDYQYRDWRGLGDREQLLLRSGITYEPKESGVKFTLGYAHITTGQYGQDRDAPISESRIYQEALFGQVVLKRLLVTHRFRYEQRFVEDEDLRTRYRFNLFVNIPFEGTKLDQGTPYFAFYNEIFINGERNIGLDRNVQFFDRNRTYLGLGYAFRDSIRFQIGWMEQTTVNWQKGQLQFSMHHTF
ncbi:DUF2490 domain-containing protein [Leeuwenhoekiella parthenopeia]|uniref:DUF2490 domain-containing protein n=1 Tax=Leeuwenhoekiella parthenopeia TaxID=2890320 RepID=A0ABS8GUR0_9FLAO|nr:DUF2490 domain-containing protein [Leeuwenhoekiella parthenopeia]MCC4212947.1 DUF2490 domain-containing protein [Leeuwenhoekiella parthenopeia]